GRFLSHLGRLGSYCLAHFLVATMGSRFLAGWPRGGVGGAMGATLLGLTSVLPTKVTPSSIASLGARTSPNNSVLSLMSTLFLAMTLPLTLPRIVTQATVILPLTTALSPRLRLPSELMSPSSL